MRTIGNPTGVIPAIREAVRRVDPTLPLQNVTTQRQAEESLLGTEVMFATTAAVFGGLALVVAAIGLFGVMSYAVAKRTKEIGVRMALGAEKAAILRGVLRESLTLVSIGVALGLCAALTTTRFVESRLFGLSPTDPATVAAAVLVMLAVSIVAGYLPAERAARVNPIVALRHD